MTSIEGFAEIMRIRKSMTPKEQLDLDNRLAELRAVLRKKKNHCTKQIVICQKYVARGRPPSHLFIFYSFNPF